MARIDEEVIRHRLDRLTFESDEIERRLPSSLERYVDPDGADLRYQLEHRMFIALQAVLDISAHIAVAEGSLSLETYRDALEGIRRLRVIDSSLAEALAGVSGLRNALAHEYLNLDHVSVYRAMQDIDELRRFAVAVWEWLEAR